MGAVAQIDHPNVIFFDGVCNLCSAAVNFIIKRDPQEVFRFSSLQSAYAERNLNQELVKMDSDSIVLKQGEQIYKESDAVLRIARNLSGGWPLLYGFIIIPKFLRDGIYQWISRHRYSWFGKKDVCMVPTQELRARFLDS